MTTRSLISGILISLALCSSAWAQSQLAGRLDAALKAAGVPIIGVSIGDTNDKATWRVHPPSLQAAAQPTIDAFNPNDPAHVTAELEAQIAHVLDTERLTASVVWTILKYLFPADTDAQTKARFRIARTRIIDVYRTAPWK